jgi:outer membrane lipoprotein-sorting protein
MVLSILIVAFVVLALQQGEDGGGGGPLNAIAQAAEKTQGEPGGRVSMRAVVSNGSKTVAMRGQMVFDDEDRSRAVVTATVPKTVETFQMQMVSDGTKVYMSSPRFGSLPEGKKWLGVDFDFAMEQGEDSLVPGNPDAEGELELLRGASDDIRKLGKEEVRGVPTTHYRSTIPVAEQAQHMQDLGADETAERFEEDASPAKVEVWIDAKGLVRRMRLTQSLPRLEDGKVATTDMRMNFFDFGIDPQIGRLTQTMSSTRPL